VLLVVFHIEGIYRTHISLFSVCSQGVTRQVIYPALVAAKKGGKVSPEREAHLQIKNELSNYDPSAGSPTETLLRLVLPLNGQVRGCLPREQWANQSALDSYHLTKPFDR